MNTSDLLPPLGPDDVYLYAHGNGAICVLHADGRSGLVPLAEAVETALAHRDAGGRVHLDHEDGPLAAQVVDRLRVEGVPTVPFDSPRPPDTWPHGTDALMEAASIGADRLLDDLVARGADLARVDESGSTALHHAAMRDNEHAIRVLVAAGAVVDAANAAGMTPRMLAAEGGQDSAVAQLDALGASAGPAPGDEFEFPRSIMTSARAYIILIVVNIVIAVALLWPPSPWDPAILAAALGVLWLFIPPFAYWRGGAAVRLEGSVLSYQPAFGAIRTMDLDRATVATSGGSVRPEPHLGARHLVVGHPDGYPMGLRQLRNMVTAQDEVATLLEHAERFSVITIAGGHRGAVLPPLGAALAVSGTLVLPAAQAQIAAARSEGWSASP